MSVVVGAPRNMRPMDAIGGTAHGAVDPCDPVAMTELPPELRAERHDLVLALLDLSPERQRVLAALRAFPWDSDGAVELEPRMLRVTLERTARGTHSVEELAQWADDIEVREDIAMTDARVRAIIHVLANPYLEGPTDAARVRAWIAELGTDNPQ
jgi:hypothetical protein